jgi:hypothetical protein
MKYIEKLFSLNSTVTDDSYDTYMNPQIMKLINYFFLNAWLIIKVFELYHPCEIYIFDRVIQN